MDGNTGMHNHPALRENDWTEGVENIETLRLKPARANDGAGIIALERELFPSVDVFKPAQIARLLRVPTCRVLVMRDRQNAILAEVVGLLRRFRGGPSGRIYKIVVHRRLQGRCIAEHLLVAMEKIFRQNGMRSVCAEARVSNTASRRFFEKHGYRMTRLLPRYYPDGEDGCKFWKAL